MAAKRKVKKEVLLDAFFDQEIGCKCGLKYHHTGKCFPRPSQLREETVDSCMIPFVLGALTGIVLMAILRAIQ